MIEQMKEFPKKYKPAEIEKKWQDYWYDNNIYKYESELAREDTYVIDTPPPTVSGMLHMGHVFSYTQADFIARYQRMKGKTVFYPMGFDDNGLPTERLVEKVKKVKGSQLERKEFVKLCKEVVLESEEEFRKLFKSIALSVDWEQEYQTISDKTRLISQMSFLDLYNRDESLVYLQEEPCYFDPIDQTALSQADIEDKEMDSTMNYIAFTSLKDQKELVIATTRPELIPACVAIFVHPDDERYKHLIGTEAETALFKVKVPILADDEVKMEKGSGIVMCCTFGDIMDISWWKKHKLKTRLIINKFGRLKDFYNSESKNDYVPNLVEDVKSNSEFSEYQKYYQALIGKKVKEARALILETLAEHKLLLKQEHITHAVKCAERSGAPIEILITTQWFVKVLDYKEELLAKVNQSKWHPAHMKIRVEKWIENLAWDWCISRQRYFGVPFPVWYVKPVGLDASAAEFIEVAVREDLPLDPLYSLPRGYNLLEKISETTSLVEKDGKKYEVRAETDVMDTWATSSLTPQISSRAINTKYYDDLTRHKKLFPADLRPQAHEIIRSWAFYTMVKALHHEQQIAWHNLMISGWCLASDKTKMSKSKGNVVTPVNLITEKSSDVVRYWASTSHLGCDTAYSEDVMSIGKKLINKLWNVAKFIAINLNKCEVKASNLQEDIKQRNIFAMSDLWILSELEKTIKNVESEFDRLEYAKARSHIDDFFWNSLCDNYLEIVKARSYGDIERINEYDATLTKDEIKAMQNSALLTLGYIAENLLKLYAPFIPHICEEIYDLIFSHRSEITSLQQRGVWPQISNLEIDVQIEKYGEFMLEIIDQVRKEKSARNLALNARVNKASFKVEFSSDSLTKDFILDLKSVNNISDLTLSAQLDRELVF